MSMSSMVLCAQNNPLSGKVLDEQGEVLPGAHVHYKDWCSVTSTDGSFKFEEVTLPAIIEVSYLGFASQRVEVKSLDKEIIVRLKASQTWVNEVAVKSNRMDTAKSRKTEVISADFLSQNMSGTFIKSLERLPGVNAMDIGANSSKPVIRGMGFNRVVVSENGVKQEGQQWGADHGMEIDPFNIETAEIVKGASGIEYGSDAIGGYINIINDHVPVPHSLSGTASILAKSVNGTLGASVYVQSRAEKQYLKVRVSVLDFGDYSVPTDHIVYLDRVVPVYHQKLKNTAGKEYDAYVQWGYVSDSYKTSLTLSNVYQKSGFFPGAHGVPDINRVQDDGNSRNIDYPFQMANHSKLLNSHKIYFDSSELSIDLAYQYNIRQEQSLFHTHYSNQPVPEKDPNLEFDFRLGTYSVNTKYVVKSVDNHRIETGVQMQYRNNDVAGYNFLLPEYTSGALGLFVKDEITLSSSWRLYLGLRYDASNLKTSSYYDSILYSYLIGQGMSADEANRYAWRSAGINTSFGDFSWLVGAVYQPSNPWLIRLNVGKAFRMPTAIELASNGVHHGSFRHEGGDANLDSEKGYYADMSMEYRENKWSMGLSPYAYYFSNYLFLQPTGTWSSLPHAGQVYQYSQSAAILAGLEWSAHLQIAPRLKAEATVEYVYNRQVSSEPSKRYPLPFTPPLNGFLELGYQLKNAAAWHGKTRFFVNSRMAASQNRVARNEKATDGYVIFGAGVSTNLAWPSPHTELVLQGFNLMNTKYYNHISFYRQVEIPEQGRNIQFMLKVPF